MKKFYLLCAFFGCFVVLSYGQQTEQYQRVRIDIKGKDMQSLAKLGIETDHGDYQPGRSFTSDFSASEIALIRQAGFGTEVLIEDLNKWYLETKDMPIALPRGGNCEGGFDPYEKYQTPVNYTYGSMGGYQTYSELMEVLDDMRTKFPHLITARAIASDTIVTHEGRPLYWVKISDNADNTEGEPEVLYTSLHHCREPNGMSQMLFYMWYLLENYEKDAQVKYIVDNLEMYFIPCVNPDGYLFNESTNPQGGGFWRKNRRVNSDGTMGVDLNRNYGYEWGFDNIGSSPNSGTDVYRGPSAFSEPETRTVRDFCRAHQFINAFNYHTFSNLLIYPWAYSDELADPALRELAQLYTRENNYKIGTASETVGYAVNGSSDDWMFGEKGTMSFTPEVGPGAWGFWPPSTAIDFLNKTALWQNISMALSALRFGELTDKSETSYAEKNIALPFSLTRYGYQNGEFTVALSPLTSNIASVGAAQVFNLARFEKMDGQLDVVLSPNIQTGEVFSLLVTLSSGDFVHTDTLEKIYGDFANSLINEAGDNLDFWATDSWGISTDLFISAPSSITDSPSGLYEANSFNIITTNAPVDIPANAQNVQLRYWTKFSIEEEWDYAQVLAGDNLGVWQPLCGEYTNTATNLQPFDQPVYDGQQPSWVEECINLPDFAGKQLWIQFSMFADDFQHFDGFYFDDLRVTYATSVGTTTVPVSNFKLEQNKPNPSNGLTLIGWEPHSNYPGAAQLQIFNTLGHLVYAQPIDVRSQSKLLLNTSEWAVGTYFYQVKMENGISAMRKLVVAK